MSKKTRRGPLDRAVTFRSKAKRYYLSILYGLYMNKWTVEGLGYQEERYLFKKLWHDGKVAMFNLKNTATEENPSGEVALQPFAPSQYNYLGEISKVLLINERGVPFIPTSLQQVDEAVVLLFAHQSRLPIKDLIDYNLNIVVNLEMILQTNTTTYKMPFTLVSGVENQDKLNELMDRLMNDEDVLTLSIEEFNAIKVLVNSNPYIADKLYQMKVLRWNEILTFLGINNVESMKKEHLIVDEVNANNNLIRLNGLNLEDSISESLERVREVLGHDLTLVEKHPMEQSLIVPDDMTNEEGGDENVENDQ